MQNKGSMGYKMELQYITGMDATLFAFADLPIECSFCGAKYKEHKDFEGFYQGLFDDNGKIACCRECFDSGKYLKGEKL